MSNELRTKVVEAKDKCQKVILDAINAFQEETGLMVNNIIINNRELYYAGEVHQRREIVLKVEV